MTKSDIQKCDSRYCKFAVTDVNPTHCCNACGNTPGEHGPRCARLDYQLMRSKEDLERRHHALAERQQKDSDDFVKKQAASKEAFEARQRKEKEEFEKRYQKEKEEFEKRQTHDMARVLTDIAAIDAKIAATSQQHGGGAPHHMNKCAGCHFTVTGVNPTHCCNACHGNHGTHGPMCKQQPAKCASHGCQFSLTGVNPTHCCNKCANHPGQHGPACKGNHSSPLDGAWKNSSGHDVTTIQQSGNQFTCMNPHQSWSPSVGTLSGNTLTFQTGGLAVGLVGTLQADGQRINFSNGCAWVRQ